MWLNDNAGILVLILGIITIVLVGIVLFLVFSLRSRFAVQRLKFVGLYSTDVGTREPYASLTIGNRSVSEIAVKEIGIRNGGVAFDLTALYRKKEGMDERTRIVIEQRHSIDFTLTVQELYGVLIDGPKGKQLKTLRLYAIDLMGNLYQGKIGAVRKLLAASMAGRLSAPAAPVPAQEGREEPTAPAQPAETPAPAQEDDAPQEALPQEETQD